jgi:uncharacterized protein (DUF1810 family)
MRDDLLRFVQAQATCLDAVHRELRAGRKLTHWMWFVFPQLRGLGRSEWSDFYGIASLAEAQSYLAHVPLGQRLVHCTELVMNLHPPRSLREVFGAVDEQKFHSCMTLFSKAAGSGDGPFAEALHRCFGGRSDDRTVQLLQSADRLPKIT